MSRSAESPVELNQTIGGRETLQEGVSGVELGADKHLTAGSGKREQASREGILKELTEFLN